MGTLWYDCREDVGPLLLEVSKTQLDMVLSNLVYQTCFEQGIGLDDLHRFLPTSIILCFLFYAEATFWAGFLGRSLSKQNKEAVSQEKRILDQKGFFWMCVGHPVLGRKTRLLAGYSVPSCCLPSSNRVWKHKR